MKINRRYLQPGHVTFSLIARASLFYFFNGRLEKDQEIAVAGPFKVLPTKSATDLSATPNTVILFLIMAE
jgi:hypothetical protein